MISRILPFLLLLAAWIPLSAAPATESLRQLDRAIAADHVSAKLRALDSLRRRAAASPEKWQLYSELADRYSNFNTDSALRYIILAHEVARDREQLTRSDLRRASLFNSSLMMYKEASDIFNSLDVDSAGTDLKRDYFILGVQLYRNLESLAPDDAMRRRYSRVKQAFRDSVLRLTPGEKFIRANELLDAGDAGGALQLFVEEAQAPGYNPANGAMYHLMARAYGRLGETDLQTEYLAMAAKADIENGVREYLALPQLALMLYEKGDVDRAYRYMQRSAEDAKACNARVRLFDMTEAVSVISDAYAARQRDSRVKLILLLVIAAISLAATGILLYYAHQRNRLLSRVRHELEESNRRLAASGNVREKYVRRFMNLSREYLEKLDSYRARLFKIAAKRNFDSLYSAIKSSEIVDSTAATFYADFDKAFLELYPDFIKEFNALLRPGEGVMLKEPDTLNTDLRIFALMKLGIYESAEIARFLHCSQSTVYNYRTRYRAKARDKEEFINHFFSPTPHHTPTITA